MRTAPPAATAVAEPPQPLPAPPRLKPAAVPAPPWAEPPVAGRFLIEVGTVTPPAEAPTVWQRLVDRHASLAALEPRPPWRVQLPDRRIAHRIVAGAFATEAQARAACADLREDGGNCRVLAP
jgi:hypothetical protein